MEAEHNVQTVARQQPTNGPGHHLPALIGYPAFEFHRGATIEGLNLYGRVVDVYANGLVGSFNISLNLYRRFEVLARSSSRAERY